MGHTTHHIRIHYAPYSGYACCLLDHMSHMRLLSRIAHRRRNSAESERGHTQTRTHNRARVARTRVRREARQPNMAHVREERWHARALAHDPRLSKRSRSNVDARASMQVHAPRVQQSARDETSAHWQEKGSRLPTCDNSSRAV